MFLPVFPGKFCGDPSFPILRDSFLCVMLKTTKLEMENLMKANCIWITGASRGIGAAIARKFAKEGWNLALTCVHSAQKLQNLKEELEQAYHITCYTFVGDMGDYETVSLCLEGILHAFGHVDVLVNNAGISKVGLFTDLAPMEWQQILSTNLTSVYNCCHQVLPSMIREKSGHIVNISSVWGCVGASCEAAYSATKGGVNALTQALAKELAPSHISVNAIACGAIDTDMNACFTEEEKEALAEEIPAGRFGQPAEVADLVWKLSQSSAYLTGQIIRLDGGWI